MSNLHYRQRNDYNKVFKRISMVSKTKCSGVKPNKLPPKTEKVALVSSSLQKRNLRKLLLITWKKLPSSSGHVGPRVAPMFPSAHRASRTCPCWTDVQIHSMDHSYDSFHFLWRTWSLKWSCPHLSLSFLPRLLNVLPIWSCGTSRLRPSRLVVGLWAGVSH